MLNILLSINQNNVCKIDVKEENADQEKEEADKQRRKGVLAKR